MSTEHALIDKVKINEVIEITQCLVFFRGVQG